LFVCLLYLKLFNSKFGKKNNKLKQNSQIYLSHSFNLSNIISFLSSFLVIPFTCALSSAICNYTVVSHPWPSFLPSSFEPAGGLFLHSQSPKLPVSGEVRCCKHLLYLELFAIEPWCPTASCRSFFLLGWIVPFLLRLFLLVTEVLLNNFQFYSLYIFIA